MGKLIKKAERGAAANYITRTRAVRKLQLSLADFRRLCILKGIYPREPRNKRKAAGKSRNPNNTFYYVKDINYLLHEPIVQKFRAHKVFIKKLACALAKNQLTTAKILEENEPRYTLDHLVKERYPTFVDALRDLDDCLTHVFLFASLPATERIDKRMVDESIRLAAEFQNYVIASRCLRKVFLSIKGIYYQAEIKGQQVTWLVPYQFSQEIPSDVDFRVMLTFLEFYQTMLSFVNYKLYTDLNLKYPPRMDTQLDENGAGTLSSLILESANGMENGRIIDAMVSDSPVAPRLSATEKKQLDGRLKTLPDVLAKLTEQQSQPDPNTDDAGVDQSIIAGVEDEDNDDGDDGGAEQPTGQTVMMDSSTDVAPNQTFDRTLFAKMTVYLSREVPRHALEFVLRAFGATVCWPETSSVGSTSPYREDSDKITHQIVDRPLEHLTLRSDRIYLQPQWVFDSINARRLLKEELYAPGKSLPPHLSPFVQYEEGDYVPDGEMGVAGDDQEEAIISATDMEDDDDNDDIDQEQLEMDIHQKEMEAEASGVPYSEFAKNNDRIAATKAAQLKRKQQTVAQKQAAEKLSMAKMVMSNRQRRQVERVERKQAGKTAEVKRLTSKKRRIAESVKKQ